MDFANLLSKSEAAANADKATFEKWQNKQITIEECIRLFCKNNHVKQGTPIDEYEFIRWMEGLGFRRR